MDFGYHLPPATVEDKNMRDVVYRLRDYRLAPAPYSARQAMKLDPNPEIPMTGYERMERVVLVMLLAAIASGSLGVLWRVVHG